MEKRQRGAVDADSPGNIFDTENPMALIVYCRRSRELDTTQSRGQRERPGCNGHRKAWGQRSSHWPQGDIHIAVLSLCWGQ